MATFTWAIWSSTSKPISGCGFSGCAARVVYICADDTHGTAIMIRARQEGRSEEVVIADMQAAHQRDFAGFEVAFDHYGSTQSQANRELCATFWKSLRGGPSQRAPRLAAI